MSIFGQEELFKKKVESVKKLSHSKNITKIIKTTEKVNGLIPEKFPENSTLHYASCSDFSTHDMLFRLIEVYGKIKNFHMATWSISNKASEMLIMAKDAGLIENMYCLLDWRVQVRTPKAKGLLKFNNIEMKVCNCHAKTFCIEFDSGEKISVVGSANLTNNPRIEAGTICNDPEIYNFHSGWIKSEMGNGKPFGIDTARIRSGRDIGEE